MEERRIGEAFVSEVGLGACLLSNEGRPDESQAIATVHAALEAGVTLIDTADAYAISEDDFGHNELLVRRALASYGAGSDGILIATKGGHTRTGTAWGINGEPMYLKRACHESLRRLGVNTLSLYQLHWPDPHVPYAESVGAMKDLLDEGLIQMCGISNVDVSLIRVALEILGENLVSVQNELSISATSSQAEVTFCAEHGIAFLAYQPLGGPNHASELGTRHRVLQGIADDRGESAQVIALAWLLAKAPNVIPIPGARRPATIADSCRATIIHLSGGEIEQLDGCQRC